MSMLGKIKASLGDVAAMDQQLGRKIEKAEARIAELRKAPIGPGDYIAHGQASIDSVGARYVKLLTAQVKHDLQRDPLDLAKPDNHFRVLAPNDPGGHLKATPEALCFFFADHLKKQFAIAVQAVDWPASEVGPALPERVKEIDKLTRDLAGLQKERQDLHDELAAAGIPLK